jgi:hypothetical protein
LPKLKKQLGKEKQQDEYMYFVEFDDIARKDLKNHYKSGNKATIKKRKNTFRID